MYTPSTKQRRGESLLSSWQAGLAEAATDKPGLASEVARHGDKILPRFAHFHAKLQALPRRTRRALQRKLSMTLAGVALMLALGSEPVSAATISVDGINCTLIDAIIAANTDTATGGCRAGSGADTLVLRPGSTHTLDSVYDDFNGPTGLPVITSEIRIKGNDATIEREETAPELRILAVSSASFTLEDVTITGGLLDGQGGGILADSSTVTIANGTISDNFASRGGGIMAEASPVNIMNSTISGNSAAFSGGGIYNDARSGGDIDTNASPVTIMNSTISGNTADGSGGGIRADSSPLTITDSTVSDNSAGGGGAGVDIFAGFFAIDAAITNSTISGNTAGGGGGGVNISALNPGSASAVIMNSTISGNTAGGSGGGVRVSAVYERVSNNVSITDSTISGNTSGGSGGGVFAQANSGADVTLDFNRSLVAGNRAASVLEIEASGWPIVASVAADNYNLFGTDGDAGVAGFIPGPTDIVPTFGFQLGDILDPNLADNGGPTLTHALVEGSPAIDAVPASEDCGDTDQRGASRPQDGDQDGVPACDVGAYEFGGIPPGVGGALFGIDVRRGTVWCVNATTHQVVKIRLSDSTSWDCEAAGLAVKPGDRIRQGMLVRGQASGYIAEGVLQDTGTAIVPEDTMEQASRRMKELILERITKD